jgi:hypothetical protein
VPVIGGATDGGAVGGGATDGGAGGGGAAGKGPPDAGAATGACAHAEPTTMVVTRKLAVAARQTLPMPSLFEPCNLTIDPISSLACNPHPMSI